MQPPIIIAGMPAERSGAGHGGATDRAAVVLGWPCWWLYALAFLQGAGHNPLIKLNFSMCPLISILVGYRYANEINSRRNGSTGNPCIVHFHPIYAGFIEFV